MKTLIISDTHLSHVFDEKKYLFLKDLFASVNQIILNGDFWDGHLISFDRFVTSPWNKLFPILKNKKAIYLYGNHDRKKFSDNRTSLFSVEQKENYLLVVGQQKYHIEHGHILQNSVDVKYNLPKKTWSHITKAGQRLEHILSFIGRPHNIILKRENLKMKKKLQVMKFPHWYICGHTHFAELDKTNKFVNSGLVQFGEASYLIVDTSGISLKTDRY